MGCGYSGGHVNHNPFLIIVIIILLFIFFENENTSGYY